MTRIDSLGFCLPDFDELSRVAGRYSLPENYACRIGELPI